MSHIICSDVVASVSELKSNPMGTVQSTGGKPLAILNRNQPVFYCVPADLYEVMMEMIDDIELGKIIEERKNDKEISVNINDL
ncbi:type II toxin-antitoxin system Phd/YefM family antitoxin [Rickettsia endosymbiont of Rhinocyllus conicus]|uniref:type II toxin-antitoxin system Phd/YefM family antitoxin n=1 Tax=Rickettsia endosymbiont of Rhinocyllus conicus TaxID=3066252 RepID=UPI003132C073